MREGGHHKGTPGETLVCIILRARGNVPVVVSTNEELSRINQQIAAEVLLVPGQREH